MLQLKFKKTHPNAKLPTQGKPGDAAFDLFCVEDFTLASGETKLVSTGLVLADMPLHYDGSHIQLQIKGRSGLASKTIFPLGGVVDATYRGELKVILYNGNQPKENNWGNIVIPPPFSFKAGDRIAQFVIERIITDAVMEESEEVTETNRGSSGFGSTGA